MAAARGLPVRGGGATPVRRPPAVAWNPFHTSIGKAAPAADRQDEPWPLRWRALFLIGASLGLWTLLLAAISGLLRLLG
jgi:hypothetical protein